MIRTLLLALCFVFPTLAVSCDCSPFSGFYVSGAGGWDYFNRRERVQDLVQAGLFNSYNFYWGKANGFQGGGFVGFTHSCRRLHLGIRGGYQAYARAQSMITLVVVDGESFRKMQSVTLDFLPGFRILPCFLVHGIFGMGYGQFRFTAYEFFTNFFRNQKRWAFYPRLGAGVQWAFFKRLTAGFEWTYQFPGNVLYPGPILQTGLTVQDQNERRVRVFGSQIALTFNYYFHRCKK